MDLPDSYSTYDESAIIAQRNHFRLIQFELILLVVVAALSLSVNLFQNEDFSTIIFSVIFFIFLIGIIIQAQYGKRQFGRKWFEFRAVAESIKSLAWQYAMECGDFYEENEANKLFLQIIKQIKETYQINPDSKLIPGGILKDIQPSMKEMRKKGWHEKRETYIKERVDNQITWYTDKAKINDDYSKKYDNSVLFLQIFIIIACIFLVYTHINGAPALALVVTLIVSIIGWSRSKQYAELVEPYQNAARELNGIKQNIEMAKLKIDFQNFVIEAEQAISREHTMWLAKCGLHSRN